MLGPRLNTIHNLRYYMDVIDLIRAAILAGGLEAVSIEEVAGQVDPSAMEERQ
jgi:queuine/archaeosine tRNA-ribosyltransferase